MPTKITHWGTMLRVENCHKHEGFEKWDVYVCFCWKLRYDAVFQWSFFSSFWIQTFVNKFSIYGCWLSKRLIEEKKLDVFTSIASFVMSLLRISLDPWFWKTLKMTQNANRKLSEISCQLQRLPIWSFQDQLKEQSKRVQAAFSPH